MPNPKRKAEEIVESHICQRQADMGHPARLQGTGARAQSTGRRYWASGRVRGAPPWMPNPKQRAEEIVESHICERQPEPFDSLRSLRPGYGAPGEVAGQGLGVRVCLRPFP